MTMEVERQQDGRWHFALGPIEKWVAGLVTAMAMFALYSGWNSIVTRQDAQADLLSKLTTQLAVMNVQLLQQQSQLVDMPALNQRVSKNEVRLDSVENSVRELRGMKGLK